MRRYFIMLLSILLIGILSSDQVAAQRRIYNRIMLYPIYENGKWGFINREGKIVIEPTYEKARPYSQGLAAVSQQGKWGYINGSGKLVIPIRYDDVLDCSEGFCGVKLSNKWFFIDHTGALRSRIKYEEVRPFSDCRAPVRIRKKWGFIDSSMNEIVSPRYEDAWTYTEGLAPVRIAKRWGFINLKGKMVIPAKYYWVDQFSEGFAFVQGGNGHEGVLNSRGQLVIQKRFYNTNPFTNGAAAVMPNAGGLVGLLDRRGNLQPGSMRFLQVKLFTEGLAPAQDQNGLYGYINPSGQYVIQPQYAQAESFNTGLARVQTQDGKLSYIDSTGKSIWQSQGDAPSPEIITPPVIHANLVGPDQVPARSVNRVGNPYKTRFPDGSSSLFARNIWDMRYYQGRIYLGSGDIVGNTGPTDIYSFAPGYSDFRLDATLPEEMVSKIYECDGRLVVPGDDPEESWEWGNLYIKENNKWRKERTIPNGVHTVNLAYQENEIVVTANTATACSVLLSRDWGKTWTQLVFDTSWFPCVFTLKGKFRGFNWDNQLYTLENGVFYPEQLTPKLYRLTHQFQEQTTRWRFTRSLPFQGKLAVTAPGSLGNGPYPFFVKNSLDEEIKMLDLFAASSVMDVISRGSILYILVNHKKDSIYVNSIYRSKDLMAWEVVATFETPSFARSFEEVDGVFYVGIGCAPGSKESTAGDVLQVIPAVRPSAL